MCDLSLDLYETHPVYIQKGVTLKRKGGVQPLNKCAGFCKSLLQIDTHRWTMKLRRKTNSFGRGSKTLFV